MRAFSLLFLIACGGASSPRAVEVPEPDAVQAADRCQPQLGDTGDWEHGMRARLTLRMGSPHHSTQGPNTVEGTPIVLRGKFAYGSVSKDLEGEVVRAFLRPGDCEWVEVGSGATDSDGRVAIELADMAAGVYDYVLVVTGDHSIARGVAVVFTASAQVVVFDIDGTLTISDGEVFEEALLGHTPEIFEGAAAVVHNYARAGVQPIYVTGRPYHFQGPTIEWLDSQHLPRGPLHTTNSVREAFPGSNVEEYKQAFVEQLTALGLSVVAAYGNASSDVCAYARAGVAPGQTWIVGEHGGSACEGFGATHALTSYEEHFSQLPLAPGMP